VALADSTGDSEFFVTDRADSSSLLRPGKNQFEAFHVREAKHISVAVRRLSDCVDLGALPHPVLIKIDVQGAELEVLKGCDTLEQAAFVYVELSFVELYQDQPLFGRVAAYLATRGFELAGVYNQTVTASFGPTQADFLFKRTGASRADHSFQSA
jgi:methyltransferase, FkbM family